MEIWRKYGESTTFLLPVIKAGAADFAVSADWTPAAGDVKVSKDDAAFSNITTLPTAVGNMWLFTLSVSEMTAARVVIQVVDSATKAVEDQAVLLVTYGHASAQHVLDLDSGNLDAAVSSRLASASYTTPPTAVAIRSEIDSNSTQLAAIVGYVDELEGRLTAVRAGLLDNLDVAVSTRLASASYTTPPTAVEVRTEIDANSTQLAAIVGYVDALEVRLTAVRAGLLDNLVLLDVAVSSVGGGGGGDATAANQATIIAFVDSLESRLTAVRAGLLDNLTNLDAPISSIPGAAAGAIQVTDLVINDGSNPIEGAEVWITTDSGGSNQVWYGVTNAAGVPKDIGDNNPWLDAGTYYIWVQRANYSFTNPTTKVVA